MKSLLLFLLTTAALAQTHPQGELIFPVGSTSFPESHASTVVTLKGGDLMAAWFGGTKERAPDVAIWGSRRHAGHWSAPVELERVKDVPSWNPVLFHTLDGKLWLYYKVGPSPGGWHGGRMVSTDEGQTWSKPEDLPTGLLGPIRAKPLVLPDGTVVAGSSVEKTGSWTAWIERSTDGGQTYTKSGPYTVSKEEDAAATPAPDPPKGAPGYAAPDKGPRKYEGIIQPSVVSLGGAHLRFYARSRTFASKIAYADSTDNGATWTQAHFLDLPNNNSGIDAVRLEHGPKAGRIVLIFNDTTIGRTPLNLAVSKDGTHFRNFAILEDTVGQYSYPAIVEAADGGLDITYTWQRRSIKYVHVAPNDIPTN